MLFKRHLFEAAFVMGGARLKKSPLHKILDPSEKNVASYYMDMAITKIFAQVDIGMPTLLHLDVYRKNYRIAKAGTQKPDFIAVSKNGRTFAILESKGRSGAYSLKTMNDAKKQSQVISRVNGSAPVFAIASGVFCSRGIYKVYWEDPEVDDNYGYTIEIDIVDHYTQYYSPIFGMLSGSREVFDRRIGGRNYVLTNLGADMYIGLDREILELLEGFYSPFTGEGVQGREWNYEIPYRETQYGSNEAAIHLDGTVLLVG